MNPALILIPHHFPLISLSLHDLVWEYGVWIQKNRSEPHTNSRRASKLSHVCYKVSRFKVQNESWKMGNGGWPYMSRVPSGNRVTCKPPIDPCPSKTPNQITRFEPVVMTTSISPSLSNLISGRPRIGFAKERNKN